MADIDLERKHSGGMGWLWGLLALLALLLIGWWVWPDDDDVEPVAVEPVVEETLPEPVATGPDVTIGDILGDPAGWIGRDFPGAEVQVAEVPTDRGFWITDNGARLFAIIIDQPQEQPKDINPEATLRIDQGTLRDATFLSNLPGAPLDQDTESIARDQQIFLVVDERYIDVLSGGEPQPGTDPALGVGGEGGNSAL